MFSILKTEYLLNIVFVSEITGEKNINISFNSKVDVDIFLIECFVE